MAATPPPPSEPFSQQYAPMDNVAYHTSGVAQIQHPSQPRVNTTLLHPYVHPQPSTSAAPASSSSQRNTRPSSGAGHPPQPTIFPTHRFPVYRTRFDRSHPAFLSLPEHERRGFDLFRRTIPPLPRHIIGRFPDETILDRVIWSAIIPERIQQYWIRNGAMGVDPASLRRSSETPPAPLMQALDNFQQNLRPLNRDFDLDGAARQWRELHRKQRAQAQQAAAMSQAGPSNPVNAGIPAVAQVQQRGQAGTQMLQAQNAAAPRLSDPRLLNVPTQGMQAYAHHPAMFNGVPMYNTPMGLAQMNGVMPPPLPPSRSSSRAVRDQQSRGNKRKRPAHSDSPSPEEDPADSPPVRKKARRGAMAPSPAPQSVHPPQPIPQPMAVPFPVFYDPSQGESHGFALQFRC